MELLEDLIVCRYLKNNFFLATLFFMFFISCQQPKKEEKETLPFYNNAQFDAEWIKETDAKYANIHIIDTFQLKNQVGHTITKDSLNGYIYVANFFFTTCPGICPKMLNNLQILQDSFAVNKQIKLVSFTVMPWVDSVEKLHEYGEVHHINSLQWHLLTGSKEKIYHLARKSYFAEKGLGLQKDSTEFLHTESMLLIDKKGRIRGIYNATQKTDVARITEDIATLLNE